MAAKVCVVTTAGLALLAAGPLPLTITKVAVGSGVWTPTAAATALNTLIKDITVTDASVVTANIVHVAVTDTSADVYSCREIGLYVGATLFAIYTQATPLFDKAVESLGLFAIDIVMTSIAPGSITVGAAGFSYPQASETVKGVAEIATSAEALAGTDDTRIITPAKLAAVLAGGRSFTCHAQPQNISANVSTRINFSSIGYDDLGGMNGSGQFVVPATGEYVFTAMVHGSTTVATSRVVDLHLGGVAVRRLAEYKIDVNDGSIGGCSGPLKLSAGDVIDIYYATNIDDTLKTFYTLTYFTGWRIK